MIHVTCNKLNSTFSCYFIARATVFNASKLPRQFLQISCVLFSIFFCSVKLFLARSRLSIKRDVRIRLDSKIMVLWNRPPISGSSVGYPSPLILNFSLPLFWSCWRFWLNLLRVFLHLCLKFVVAPHFLLNIPHVACSDKKLRWRCFF